MSEFVSDNEMSLSSGILRGSALVVVGALAGLAFERLAVPASWLLGPMVVAVVYACIAEEPLRVPRRCFSASQAIVGCVLARAFDPELMRMLAHAWSIMLAVVIAMVLLSAAIGWMLARFGTMDAPTATLGSTPGAASAMTVLAIDYGADPRVVAFMQYMRVVLVVVIAAMLARFGFHEIARPPAAFMTDQGHHATRDMLITLGIAVVGAPLAKTVRLPSGNMLGPMILGSVLGAAGLVHITLSWWLVNAAYLTLGLTVGLLFSRESVRYVIGVLPQLLLGTLALLVGCALLSLVLVHFAHVDPLTAYLATSPGGMDSVAVIALSGPANLPVVLSLQAARLFIVILTGPGIARFVASHVAA